MNKPYRIIEHQKIQTIDSNDRKVNHLSRRISSNPILHNKQLVLSKENRYLHQSNVASSKQKLKQKERYKTDKNPKLAKTKLVGKKWAMLPTFSRKRVYSGLGTVKTTISPNWGIVPRITKGPAQGSKYVINQTRSILGKQSEIDKPNDISSQLSNRVLKEIQTGRKKYRYTKKTYQTFASIARIIFFNPAKFLVSLATSVMGSMTVSLLSLILMIAMLLAPLIAITGFIDEIFNFFTIYNEQEQIMRINEYIAELDFQKTQDYYNFDKYNGQSLTFYYDENIVVETDVEHVLVYYLVIENRLDIDKLRLSIKTHHDNMFQIVDTVQNGVVTRTLIKQSFDDYLKENQDLMISKENYDRYVLRKENDTLSALVLYGNPFPGNNWHTQITSGYGKRLDPYTGQASFHDGIDIGYPTGTPIAASMPGKIEFFIDEYGALVVEIINGDKVVLYGHLDESYVKTGQSVKIGDIIGTVGSTGYSTGPHLHLGLYINGKTVDPYFYFKTDK